MLESPHDDSVHRDLIQRIQKNEVDAFEQLYDSCSRLVFSFAYRIVRDQLIAEEIAQEVFLKVWRDAASYDPDRGCVRAWLVVMTRTRALDQLRLSRRREAGLEQWQRASLTAADPRSVDRKDEGRVAAASAVVGVLPEADRILMELAFREGLSHHQLAVRLGQPLGTIKTRLRRSLGLLRAAIGSPVPTPFTWLSWPQLPASSPASTALDNVRVVVVDDDADTLRLLTLVLERAGASVSPAASAAQAFKRISAALPDVLLTDIEMPGEDGYGLLQRVRRLADRTAERLPAVAFTAHDTPFDRSRAAAAGFNLHIPKPIQPSLLVTRVASLVRPIETQRVAG